MSYFDGNPGHRARNIRFPNENDEEFVAWLAPPLSTADTDIVFSDSNRQMNYTGGVIATPVGASAVSRNSGKRYIEFSIVATPIYGGSSQGIGLSNRAGAIAGLMGDGVTFSTTFATGFSWRGTPGAGQIFFNGGAGAALAAVGQTIQCALDIATGQLWIKRTIDAAWLGGGDPVAGTSPTQTYAAAGRWFPVASCESGGATDRFRVRGNTGDFIGTPPAGFAPWGAA